MPKLTDVAVKQFQPEAKDYKKSDGGGLHLLVKNNGSKCWRYSYRYLGKQKLLALGTYPAISLKAAREAMAAAKIKLANNVDPSQEKRQAKQLIKIDEASRFELFAKAWWDHQNGTWTADHAQRVWRRLEVDAFPLLGDCSIHTIKARDVINVIQKIENRGALDVAKRVLQSIRSIFIYAVQFGHLENNPASDLTGILKASKTEHRPSLPREELPVFLKELSSYQERGRTLTKLAIELLILTFVRSKELRLARWAEFDLENKVWRIPAERMKMKEEHLVPLSNQVLVILEQIREISGKYELLFPSERDRTDGMSDNTMRRAIFKLGYDGETTGKSKCVPHGFRSTACSILNESNLFNADAIERQLSHVERNGVRAAYNHGARYMVERVQMMQWWADYIDQQRAIGTGENVLKGNFGKAV